MYIYVCIYIYMYTYACFSIVYFSHQGILTKYMLWLVSKPPHKALCCHRKGFPEVTGSIVCHAGIHSWWNARIKCIIIKGVSATQPE